MQFIKEIHACNANGAFFMGDAVELIPQLLAEYRQKVQLVYIDPPFQTGDSFSLKIDGNHIIKHAYSDTLTEDAYLNMMRKILEASHALLHVEGSIYLHIDYRMGAKLKLLLDEIFGEKNFMNEIIWVYKSGGRSTRYFPRKHDTILFYRKSARVYFNITAVGMRRGAERRNHMKRFIDEQGRVCYSIRSNGKLYTYHEDMPTYPSDVWTDIEHLHQRDPERNGYATQKPEALLRRIIRASSKPGDLILDFFSGSGTTAAVAAKEGRAFVVCDNSPFAQYAIRKRLLKNCDILSEAGSFTMYSSANALFPYPYAHVQKEEDGLHICIKAQAKAEHGILYCAAGHFQNNVFKPFICVDMPTLPVSLKVPYTDALALQIVDYEGCQRLWSAV